MSAAKAESPLFVKSYEMLVWLLPHAQKFPKSHRFVLAKRMEDAALDFHDAILSAAKRRDPKKALAALVLADERLEHLKVHNRLAKDLQLHAFAQYEHLARLLDELGRLVGGWLKTMTSSPGPHAARGGAT